jgi:hypothetical protein
MLHRDPFDRLLVAQAQVEKLLVNYPRLEGGGLGGMSITNRLSS